MMDDAANSGVGAQPGGGASESGAGYGNAQGYENTGGGMDSSGGTGSDGSMNPGHAGDGDSGQADQAVQRSETPDAEDVALEAGENLIDSDEK